MPVDPEIAKCPNCGNISVRLLLAVIDLQRQKEYDKNPEKPLDTKPDGLSWEEYRRVSKIVNDSSNQRTEVCEHCGFKFLFK